MKFTKASERPKSAAGRTGEPNPFADAVADLVKNGTDKDTVAAQLTKAEVGAEKTVNRKRNGKTVTEKVFAGIEKARRQLRELGTTHGVTIRSHVEMHDNGSATLYFWKAPRITRGADASAPVTGGPQAGEGDAATPNA